MNRRPVHINLSIQGLGSNNLSINLSIQGLGSNNPRAHALVALARVRSMHPRFMTQHHRLRFAMFHVHQGVPPARSRRLFDARRDDLSRPSLRRFLVASHQEAHVLHARVHVRSRRAIQRRAGQRDRGGVLQGERVGELEDDRYSRARRREATGVDVQREEIGGDFPPVSYTHLTLPTKA